MTVTIYHNPACGTSRNTLAMIRESGVEPVVVEYLKNPPTRERLVELLRKMGISARELLRQRGTPFAELGLADTKWSEDELIGFMLKHPILIERPIVETPKGARLCRPEEKVLEIFKARAANPWPDRRGAKLAGTKESMIVLRTKASASARPSSSAGGWLAPLEKVLPGALAESPVLTERGDISTPGIFESSKYETDFKGNIMPWLLFLARKHFH